MRCLGSSFEAIYIVLFGLGHSNISSLSHFEFGNYGYTKRGGCGEQLFLTANTNAVLISELNYTVV